MSGAGEKLKPIVDLHSTLYEGQAAGSGAISILGFSRLRKEAQD